MPGPPESTLAAGFARQSATLRARSGRTRDRGGRAAPPPAQDGKAKLSEDTGYLVGGYQEAMLYAAEYAGELGGWPRAILVVSSALPGAAPSREDEVVAADWARWVPEEVLDGLLEGL